MTEYERKWVAPECRYRIDGEIVSTIDGTPQKITGTMMGGLLGVSPWATPFTTSTKLMGVWNEDIGDKPAVVAGKLLEGRIIDYADKVYDGSFYPAEVFFDPRTGKHSEWGSDFEDDVFAGHVDGIVTKDGEDYILEVKTANPMSARKWVEHPPEHYLWQVYLYNHFVTKKDKAYMLLGVIDPKFYGNPNQWIPDRTNTFLYEVPIDQKMVAETVEQLRQVYMDTIAKGVSLPLKKDDPLDAEIMQHLKDIQMPSDELTVMINDYIAIRKANEEYLDRNKENIEKEDSLKERIKDVMVTNGIAKAGRVEIRTSNRTSFDFKTADIDGFDYSKYAKQTEVKTFAIKKE